MHRLKVMWYYVRRFILREKVYRKPMHIRGKTVITENTHYDETVMFHKGGQLAPEAGVTITLNNHFFPPPIFEYSEDEPEWWGQGKGD